MKSTFTAAVLLLPICLAQAQDVSSTTPSKANLSIPGPNPTPPSLNLPIHPIYRFQNDSKCEALFLRSNDQILISVALPPRLYQVDPNPEGKNATLVHAFAAGDLLGLTELAPDRFYAAATNRSANGTAQRGTYAIWEIDVRDFAALPNGTVTHPAAVREVARVPKAKCINGVTTVYSTEDPAPNFVLAADCFAGLLWKIDVATGQSEIAGNETSFRPVRAGINSLGINGVKVQDGHLYYTNTATSKFWRIPIDERSGLIPSGAKAELIAEDIRGDDFALDAETKFAYVAGASTTNVVYRVDLRCGKIDVLAGKFNDTSSELQEPTAVQFGRGIHDKRSIYVTTNGGNPKSKVGSQGVSRIDVGDEGRAFIF